MSQIVDEILPDDLPVFESHLSGRQGITLRDKRELVPAVKHT